MTGKPLYLNGKWVSTSDTLSVYDKATGELISDVSTLKRSQVATAISDAHEAYLSWRDRTAKNRGDYLRACADELLRRKKEIASIITKENGKPLAQSLGEVDVSADHLYWYSEEARRAYGRTIPHQMDNKRHLIIKSPIGVVGAISPWNFPLVLAVRKIAPALAAGCTVIIKPASYTPLSVLAFAECVDSSGVPAGVFQVVVGSAKEIGAEFTENHLCRKITFTGSTPVGQDLIRAAAQTVTPLSLELGGHAPVIVFADSNIELAVETVMVAKYRNNSQSCIAANRIFVQDSIYETFLESFVKRTKALKVGNGMDSETDIGPLVDGNAVKNALEQIDDATAKGARLMCGGLRLNDKENFLSPAVIADVPLNASCMKEESFAPIAPVCSFRTEDEVVSWANDSMFGLAAYVCTGDLNRMFRMGESLEAGTIGINDGAPTASHCPFGGTKQSGWGRELGSEGMDAFLETKHISIGAVHL